MVSKTQLEFFSAYLLRRDPIIFLFLEKREKKKKGQVSWQIAILTIAAGKNVRKYRKRSICTIVPVLLDNRGKRVYLGMDTEFFWLVAQ